MPRHPDLCHVCGTVFEGGEPSWENGFVGFTNEKEAVSVDSEWERAVLALYE
ncbi:MAG: hypothetical protein IIY58_03310 [Aeriscardovia sp.]|nr:hypothetical protein [Aeriscardovia sp.]